MGYFDGIVTIKPQVNASRSGVCRLHVRYGEVMRIKLLITYERRPPAPEEIEVWFNTNLSRVEVSVVRVLPNGSVTKQYINLIKFIEFEPWKLKIRESEVREAWLIIKFPRDFPASSIRHVAPSAFVPFSVVIPANHGKDRPLNR